MGDTSCTSINAALSQCMPCPAAPATRRWVLADRVTIDRARPGQQIDVRLGSVPQRDSLGRIAHVRGIYVEATGEFTVGPAYNGGATSYLLRSLFSALYMQDVTGHAFWPSIDATDILDDNWARHYARVQGPMIQSGTQGGVRAPRLPTVTADYGIPIGTPAGPFNVLLSWYAPLVTLGPGMNPLAGLIALAALQKQSNAGALRFRLLQQPMGAPISGLTFDGVLNGEGNPGLDVWLDVVYLPALAIGPTWTLDSYTLPESSGVLRYEGDTTEHVMVRYKPWDGQAGQFGGASLVNNLDIFTLTVAGFVEMSGLSFDDALRRMMLYYQSERDSAMVRANAAQDLPLSNPVSGDIEVMQLLPFRQRGQGAASGSIEYRYGSIGSNAFVRYLHRAVSCNEAAYGQAIVDAVGCDPCSKSVMTDGQGKPTDRGMTTGTLLVLDPQANGGTR